MKNTSARYGRLAQLFHWTTVGLLLITVPAAWMMIDLPNRWWRVVLYNLHESIGVTLFGLTVLRLAWRQANPVPDLPASVRSLEAWLARLTHGLLYVILFAMPASGYLMTAGRKAIPSNFSSWCHCPPVWRRTPGLRRWRKRPTSCCNTHFILWSRCTCRRRLTIISSAGMASSPACCHCAITSR